MRSLRNCKSVQRIATIYALAIIALVSIGCSGLCHATLHNDTDQPITVDLSYLDEGKRDGRDDQTIDLYPGDEEEVSLWFITPPDKLNLTIKSPSGTWKRIVRKAKLPDYIQEGSSASTTFHIHFLKDRITINGLTFMDKFGWLVWIGGFLGLFVLLPVVVGQVLAKRYRSRHQY